MFAMVSMMRIAGVEISKKSKCAKQTAISNNNNNNNNKSFRSITLSLNALTMVKLQYIKT